MKKILSILAFGTFIFGMAGCSNTKDEDVAGIVEKEIESVDELSDDLYRFEVSVNGEIYQFPMHYDQFENLGWVYEGDATENLDADSYTTTQFAELDDLRVFVDLINFAPETRAINESYVGGMTFEKYHLNEADVEILLPNEIVFNESTLEDIEAAYGTPSETHETDLFTNYTYGADIYKRIEFIIFKDTGVLEKVAIRNFEKPDDLADAEVVTDPPEQIANYQYPESVGDNLFDYQLEYDGTIYNMPIPVAKLLENGWQDVDDEETLDSGGFSTIHLMKDNQTVRCHLMNYFDFVTIIENTHVTKIESRSDGPKVSIELPHGITLGMDKKEFEKAISEYDYQADETRLFTSYRMDDPDLVNSGFTFLVDAETNVIDSIIIEYDPGTLD